MFILYPLQSVHASPSLLIVNVTLLEDDGFAFNVIVAADAILNVGFVAVVELNDTLPLYVHLSKTYPSFILVCDEFVLCCWLLLNTSDPPNITSVSLSLATPPSIFIVPVMLFNFVVKV